MTSDHYKLVRFVVACVTMLSMTCAITGGILLYLGFQGGELLANGATNGVTGLIGLISMRGQQHPESSTTVTGDSATVVTPPAA